MASSAPTAGGGSGRAEVPRESLAPQERVLPDGSRAGSLAYVDHHGDLVQVRYVAGPAAGPRGFRLVELPVQAVHATAKEADTRRGRGGDDVLDDVLLEPQESAPALRVIPPPQEVRRAPTPRPSDAFWQPRENSDVARKERSEMRRPPPARSARARKQNLQSRGRRELAANRVATLLEDDTLSVS